MLGRIAPPVLPRRRRNRRINKNKEKEKEKEENGEETKKGGKEEMEKKGNDKNKSEKKKKKRKRKEDVTPADKENSDTFEEDKESLPSPDKTGHTCVMVHTNKLCLLTLSHRHPVLAEKKEITDINFDVGKFNRLNNQVSGKGKRGAQQMGLRSPLCIITCSDASQYTVLAGVNGKLVEVNERLISTPQLLTQKPNAEGYLAIVLPPLRNGVFGRSKLFSKEEYEALL